MAAHGIHELLPGYSEGQLLHDGCEECEDRARARDLGIGALDRPTFLRAWTRAVEFNRQGLADVSAAELPILCALWAVQVQLERLGVPVGYVPVF